MICHEVQHSTEVRTIFSMDFPENIMRPRRDLMSFIFASGAACTMVSVTVSFGSRASDYSNQASSQQAVSGLDILSRVKGWQMIGPTDVAVSPFAYHNLGVLLSYCILGSFATPHQVTSNASFSFGNFVSHRAPDSAHNS